MEINFLNLIIWYFIFLLSTTFHEASHAIVGKLGGDTTATERGLTTLDPLPHIKRSPFGMVVLPLISYFQFGWMVGFASVPYNPKWEYDNPRKAALMSLAGPMANFILAAISFFIIKYALLNGKVFYPHELSYERLVISNDSFWAALTKVLSISLSLNTLLFVFNLIPFPPLDGSGVIHLFLTKKISRKFIELLNNPGISFMGLLAAWIAFDKFFYKIFLFVLKQLYR